jgi:hypothetical protein
MMPGYDDRQIKARLLVWWAVWASTLGALILIYAVVAAGKPLPAPTAQNSLEGLVGVVPLFISVIIRWLVLPRGTDPARALVLFIIGISLAEACGILGIFLGGPYRDSLFTLGLLGIVQYVPFFAKRLFDPKGAGFIPNN